MGRKRIKRATMWSVEGPEWIYRKPFLARGKWRVRRRHKEEDGRIQMITLVSENETDAKTEVNDKANKEIRAAEDAKKSLTTNEPVEVTLGKALDEWIATIDARPITKADYAASVGLYKRLLKEDRVLSGIALSDFEILFFGRNAEKIEENGKKVQAHDVGALEGSSGKTKIKHRMQLVRFWRWAIRHRYALTNVPEMIEVPKKWREEVRIANHSTGQAITMDEARTLLEKCAEPFSVDISRRKFRPYREDKTDDRRPPPYLRLFVIIALRAGLRVSNIIPLRDSRKKADPDEDREPLKPGLLWRHIDLAEKMIRIEPELMKNGLPFVVPMHDELAEILEGLRKSLGRVPGPEEPVIPEPPMELKRAFHGALKRAGLGDRGFRIHDLRHTWASWCGRYCVEEAKKRLGGWAASTVHDRYSQHQEVEFLRAEINKMPRLFSHVAATAKRARKKRSRA